MKRKERRDERRREEKGREERGKKKMKRTRTGGVRGTTGEEEDGKKGKEGGRGSGRMKGRRWSCVAYMSKFAPWNIHVQSCTVYSKKRFVIF